jgi:hypothetical protein
VRSRRNEPRSESGGGSLDQRAVCVEVLQIDPWNRLEHQRETRESETDYIGRCLTALHAFA